ncbi:MAG: hypothetical protein ACI9QL_004047, partial [Candidatus Omnitrophota bacterium]
QLPVQKTTTTQSNCGKSPKPAEFSRGFAEPKSEACNPWPDIRSFSDSE